MENYLIDSQIDLRLDVFVSEKYPSITRSHIKQLITDGNILLNGKKVKAGEKLRLGDEVSVNIPQPKPLKAIAEEIELDIVYEDDDVAVINKPQGMVVHPACGNFTGTMVNALLYKLKNLSGINGVLRPGIVHRLDKDTSGLILVAKNDTSHKSLAEQIKTKECKRIYRALVYGSPKEDSGTITTNIARSKKNRKKMAVVPEGEGKEAITNWCVITRYRGYTYMEYELKTGRTHQIRVHSAYMGYPIVGDVTYGRRDSRFSKLKGQLLHAYKINFRHPTTGEIMEFTASIPDYFQNILNILLEK